MSERRPPARTHLRRAGGHLLGGAIQLGTALLEMVGAVFAAVGLDELFGFLGKRSGPVRRAARGVFRGLGRVRAEGRNVGTAMGTAAGEVRSTWTNRVWLAVVGVGLATLLPLVVTDPLRRASFGTALYVALAAVGLNVAIGLGGMPSLGQGAFVGVGAFGSALLSSKAGWDAGPAVVVAVLAATLAGVVVGWGASRLRGPFVAVATWVVSWLLVFALVSFPALSGGAQGLVVREGSVSVPWTGVSLHLTAGVHYEIALALLAVALIAFAMVSRSPLGLALSAVRRGPAMAAVAGVRSRPLLLGAFTASAAVGGLAGALLVQLAGIADPTVYGPLLSVELFVAVLLGGEGTIFGPVFGAAVLSALPSAAHGLGSAAGASRYQPVITSVLLLVALLLGRGGVPRLLDRRRGRGRGTVVPAVAGAASNLAQPARRPAKRRRNGSANGARDAEPVLAGKGLVKRFGGVVALNDLSLSIPPGQIHAVIGPNGSGKTTLLRVFAGVTAADSGEVVFDGRDVTALPAWDRFRLGVARAPARTTVMPELTTLQHVSAGVWSQHRKAGAVRTLLSTPQARESSARIRTRAEEVLALTGLSGVAASRVGELSGAEQRLVMLATAYASSPEVMLVDEPSSGLSGQDAERVTDLLLVLREAGTTILLVEHNLPVVREAADRVTVLDAGSIIAQGTPAQVARRKVVLDAYLGEAAIELMSSPNGQKASSKNGKKSTARNGKKSTAKDGRRTAARNGRKTTSSRNGRKTTTARNRRTTASGNARGPRSTAKRKPTGGTKKGAKKDGAKATARTTRTSTARTPRKPTARKTPASAAKRKTAASRNRPARPVGQRRPIRTGKAGTNRRSSTSSGSAARSRDG